MRILMATSELVPFAKTGGLADVCGALPVALSKLGHEPIVFLPAYRTAIECGQLNQQTDIEYDVVVSNKRVAGRLLRSHLPGTDIPVYLVEQDDYYDRPQLYGESGEDYRDNCERFVFFCRSVMEAIRLLNLNVDIIHCNDWQTGLIPAYLKTEFANVPGYERIGTLMTIHNMAYQGKFWHWDMLLTGIDWKYFNWHQMEFWGQLNLLKTGIVFADAINTVSPRYAKEIQQTPFGCGLEGVLTQRRNMVRGILNGVDYSIWNPEDDDELVANYGVDDWQFGKAAAKRALGSEVNLTVSDDVPLFGMIGRLADQKGLDLVADVLPKWLEQDVQWVVLGSGDPKYHEMFQRMAAQYPDKITVRLEFSNQLAHRIEAASDMFLMPSQYEPCGLNQLYSLRYGTIPIVRSTGGLADTIVDAHEMTISNGTANGFCFESYRSEDLDTVLQRAVAVFGNKTLWSQLVETGMRQDWSWNRSANQYVELYREIIAQVEHAVWN